MKVGEPNPANFNRSGHGRWIAMFAGALVLVVGLFWFRFARNPHKETAPTPEITVGQSRAAMNAGAQSPGVAGLDQNDSLEVGQSLKKKVLSLKGRADAAKKVADPLAPFYLEGLDYQQLGWEALEEKSYLQAQELYTKAVRAFGMSQPPTNGSDVVVRVKDEKAELDQAVEGLVKLYQSLVKSKDVDGLANFLHYSKSERQRWETFFETAKVIEVGVTVSNIRLLDTRAETRLKVRLFYFHDDKTGRKNRAFDLLWKLEKVVQGWRIVQ